MAQELDHLAHVLVETVERKTGLGEARTIHAALGTPLPNGQTDREDETTIRLRAMVNTALPPAVSSGLMALGFRALKTGRIPAPLKAARFVNLLLASMVAGNGVGSIVFVHPALRELPKSEFFAAERALTGRYPEIMRPLMPATVASCLAVLGLMRDRRSPAFPLTLAGTAGFIAMIGLTGLELPLNKQTLLTSPQSPPTDWQEQRAEWERVNKLRVLAEVIGWSCLCLAALTETRHDSH